MLRNFLFRIRQYASDNRAKVIKWLLIAAAAFVLLWTVFYIVENVQRWKYEKQVQALDRQMKDLDQQAKDAEARAEVLKRAIDQKYAEIQFLEARANTAEAKLRDTKQKTITLKEAYETIRYVPMPVGPVSCLDACASLAAVGYPCR